MKLRLLVSLLALGTLLPAPVAQAQTCQFVLGFLALYQQIPDVMGACVTNETPAPNGDSLQPTANGLAVYRAADNWTAFTDGFRTWINGPNGIQQRLNTERFSWEPDFGGAGTTPAPATHTGPAGTFNPAGVTLRFERAFGGFNNPLGLVAANDGSGRLFVVEKRGTIRVIRNGQPIANQFFLDIRDRVNSGDSERGLLGLAFHPRYRENGLFYVNYTNRAGNTEIVRFRANAGSDTADVTTAQLVLGYDQPAANHNGGNLLFGPDGFLYIGTGDGGGAGDQFNNGQNPGTLLGKMLRIDVDRAEGGRAYAIPPGNPFAGQAGWRPEIWAYGLRNPWRYQFDRATGDLWIADVGQNIYEEVNFQAAGQGGQNYGWPRMEGLHCFRPAQNCDQSGITRPVGEYSHVNGNCSVTGGFVYRGSAQPLLRGAYVFGDYCSGIVWTIHRDAGGSFVQTQMLDTNVTISSFGEDEGGELYATGLADGNIYRVVAAPR